MSVFCLLWVPFFYLFRRSFCGGGDFSAVWAVLFGSLTAILQFFLGYLVSPGGFGFSRWLFGFIDIVSFPVLVPFIVYTVLSFLKGGFSDNLDYANFALLWLIPIGVMRAATWSAADSVILLVAVPMLWTALAVGIPFFINLMFENFRWYTAAFSILCILLLPVLAAFVYWAFYSHQTALGFLLFFIAQIPLGVSLAFDVMRN